MVTERFSHRSPLTRPSVCVAGSGQHIVCSRRRVASHFLSGNSGLFVSRPSARVFDGAHGPEQVQAA